MVHERLVVRVIHLDRDKPDVLDARREKLQRAAVGRVVALHVGDLQDATGAVSRRGDAVAVRQP